MSRVYHVSIVDLDRRLSVIEERLEEIAIHFPNSMGNEAWFGKHEEEEKSYEIPMEVNGELVCPENMFVEGDVEEMVKDLEKDQKMQNLFTANDSFFPLFFLKNYYYF
jgi:hypothetical protein